MHNPQQYFEDTRTCGTPSCLLVSRQQQSTTTEMTMVKVRQMKSAGNIMSKKEHWNFAWSQMRQCSTCCHNLRTDNVTEEMRALNQK